MSRPIGKATSRSRNNVRPIKLDQRMTNLLCFRKKETNRV